MNASCISEDIDHHRRRFFCTAAMGIAATAGAFSLLPENALPQFMTEINGLDIHFIHVLLSA